ncbi:hypothetical protein TRVA0_004S04522 [Trichomonascus vanleenenianus]|uniref:uncharacterized protein n=1 Tax=Trichomonascus vanleenenianus TaxID=2268995 RepID=UPI003ECB408F
MERPVLTEITNTRGTNEPETKNNEFQVLSSNEDNTPTQAGSDIKKKDDTSQLAAIEEVSTKRETGVITKPETRLNPASSDSSNRNDECTAKNDAESKYRDASQRDDDKLTVKPDTSSSMTNPNSPKKQNLEDVTKSDIENEERDASPRKEYGSIADRTASFSSSSDAISVTTPPSSTSLSNTKCESFEVKADNTLEQQKWASPPPPPSSSRKTPKLPPRCLKLAHGLKMRLQYAYYKVLTDQKQLSMDQLSPPDSWSIRTFSEATSHARKRHKKSP